MKIWKKEAQSEILITFQVSGRVRIEKNIFSLNFSKKDHSRGNFRREIDCTHSRSVKILPKNLIKKSFTRDAKWACKSDIQDSVHKKRFSNSIMKIKCSQIKMIDIKFLKKRAASLARNVRFLCNRGPKKIYGSGDMSISIQYVQKSTFFKESIIEDTEKFFWPDNNGKRRLDLKNIFGQNGYF